MCDSNNCNVPRNTYKSSHNRSYMNTKYTASQKRLPPSFGLIFTAHQQTQQHICADCRYCYSKGVRLCVCVCVRVCVLVWHIRRYAIKTMQAKIMKFSQAALQRILLFKIASIKSFQ